MIDFESPTQLHKQIEKLKDKRKGHYRDYLYGGRNVYWDAKRKVDEIDQQIDKLQTKKNKIESKQLKL